ncbi:LacI family DNA-binding transcriptional regulator [Lentilactobacillus hilgardii]|uniref:LacI family DNA-binding transcriptional regulator n=2 Tax=Lentilactobacillus hilgardii TaxID=1588 RepID=UPI001CC1D008|nr:LacI family DNA-binding transcriptional regulator [Lentilactobacillus hilgardii]
MTATIKDIAQKSGFSTSTVSRALNNDPHILVATRKKIIQVAKQLDYKPNFNASTLVTGGSHSVGIIFPSTNRYQSNPFYLKIISGMNEALAQNGYVATIALADTTEQILNIVTTMAQQAHIKKFVFLYHEDIDPIRNYLDDQKLQYVTIGNSKAGTGVFIDNDNDYFGQLAAKKIMTDFKATNILFAKSHSHLLFEEERLAGIKAGLAGSKARLSIIEVNTSDSNKSVRNQLNRIDGIIAAQDEIAEFIYQVLLIKGLDIPIVTFNNSLNVFNHQNNIYSYDLKPKEIGKVAVEKLFSIENLAQLQNKIVYHIS